MKGEPNAGNAGKPANIRASDGEQEQAVAAPVNQNRESEQRESIGRAEEENAEEITARATQKIAWLTGALVFVNAIYAGVAGWQLITMQGQLNEMRDEQRPWIYADAAPSGQFYRTQSGGIGVVVSFTFHNTGHLPARYVFSDIEGFLSGEGGVSGEQTVLERQKKICSSQHQQPNAVDQMGITVFPGQTPIGGNGVGISRNELDETHRRDPGILIPWFAGCIRYRDPNGREHQTGVAYTIGMKKSGSSNLFVIPEDPTTIPEEMIVFSPWIGGGANYDY